MNEGAAATIREFSSRFFLPLRKPLEHQTYTIAEL
ncbi:MAG: hypothetical protein ACI9H6_000203 [Patiriisocius sp.]|jgi:hypothetical protein